MKKTGVIITSLALSVVMLTGCTSEGKVGSSSDTGFDKSNPISVVSREVGTGIRRAVAEFFGLVDDIAEEADNLFDSMKIKTDTNEVLAEVKNDAYAIGFVPLSVADETVKTLKIDGVEPTVENARNKSYKLCHDLNLISKKAQNVKADDFSAFVFSSDGQKIIDESGYVSEEFKTEFKTSGAEGELKIACTDSAEPLFKKLVSEYNKQNPKLKITLDTANSTDCVKKLASGSADVSVIARGLYKSEQKEDLSVKKIATDIVVAIVNKQNEMTNLTSQTAKSILSGKTTAWDKI